MKDFNNLVEVLKKHNYVVKVEKDKFENYNFAKVSGNNIIAGFCTPSGTSSSYIDGKIAADHKECFDKWSKCPLCLPIPKNDKQIKFLLEQLEFWASKEGFKMSDEYDVDKWVKGY